MKNRIQITTSVKLKGSLLLLGEMWGRGLYILFYVCCNITQHYKETYIIK